MARKPAKQARKPRTRVTPTESAYQLARMRAAADAIRMGHKQIPLVCEHCGSSSTYSDVDDLDLAPTARMMRERPTSHNVEMRERKKKQRVFSCVVCGRKSNLQEARKIRRAKIRAFIAAGIDPLSIQPANPRGD